MSRRLTDHDRYLRGIAEAEWQRTVESIAFAAGWRYYHPPDNRARHREVGPSLRPSGPRRVP